MSPPSTKRLDTSPLERRSPSSAQPRPRVTALVACEPARAGWLDKLLSEIGHIDCSVTVSRDVASLPMEVLRETHDVFIVDGHPELAAKIDDVIDVDDSDGPDGPALIVLVDDETPSWTLPRAAIPIPAHGIRSPMFESLFRLAVDRVFQARRLRRASRRYALATANSNDGFWHWDVRDNRCVYSSRWRTMLGMDGALETAGIEAWLDRVHPDDIEGLRSNLDAHLAGLSPIHDFEHRVRHRNGRWRWVVTRGTLQRDTLGQAIELSGSITDITRRKSSETMLQTDATTGLASRMLLMESLGAAIENHRRAPHRDFVLLFLNVDGFKVVNESIGLESGDRILSQLGERLLGSVASSHLVCRYGGDEFAILMTEDATIEEAQQTSDIIRDGLNRPFVIDGQEVFTSVSAGITSSQIDYERPAEVLRDVGIALTEAKRRHKGGCVVFQREMRQHAMSTLRLQTELRQAVDRDEFAVFYQPIVNLETLVITGFEALVRWRHPSRGVVFPDEFIPLAEETKLILPIGLRALERACAQLARWSAAYPTTPPLTVSVNLSSVQVSSPSIVDDVRRVIETSGIEPSQLKLEITESMFFEDTSRASKVLMSLRDLGVKLYIDDFGTGYSSFTYLHEFPATGLKIDKSFVELIGKTERPAAIVPTIISLANSLSLDVVAEGVETPQQRDLLRALSCNEAQGYLFGEPIDANIATKAVAERHQQTSATMPQASAPAADGPGRRYRR